MQFIKIKVKVLKPIFLFLNDNKSNSFSFFVVTSIYFFSGIFFGIDFTDSFYHLNQALNPAHNIYLYPFFLSSLIIKWLVKNLGPEVIYLRIINSTLLYLSLLLPFFVNKANALLPKNLYLISTVLILFAPFNVNILGYDSLSIFILSIIFSVTILYVRKTRFYFIFLLSILSAIAILIRLPNVLVVLVLIFAIGLIEYRREGKCSAIVYTHPIVFLLLNILWVFQGYNWYYPGFEEFFEASANANSHDLVNLLKNYLMDGVQLFSFIIFFITGFLLVKKLNLKFSKALLFALYGICLFLFIALYVVFSKYSQQYSFLLTALAVSITLIQLFNQRKSPLDPKSIILYLFLLFLFINPFGSNTGLLKATSLVILAPFVLSYINFRFNNFWLLIITILIPFSFLENFYSTYEDKGVFHLDQSLTIGKLYPIQTTEIRSEYLKEVDLEVSRLKRNNIKVFFYGDKSHIFHYLYPETALNINSFFQPMDTLAYYPRIEQVKKENSKVAVFLIEAYPRKEVNEQSLLGAELENDGFKKIKKESISYYLKK